MTIPETHYTLSLRGIQGVGKSRLASIVAKRISDRESMPVIVVCMESKLDSTIPWYKENCPEFRLWKGITYMLFRKMKNSIAIIEDAPIVMRTWRREQIVQSLVTALSRQNRIFTMITSQHPKRLPTALTIEQDVLVSENNQYFYRVVEGRNATDPVDWTCQSNVDEKKIEPILDAIYKGVEGKRLFRRGVAIVAGSLRSECYKLFGKGFSPKQVCRERGYVAGSKEYHNVYVYYRYWKKLPVKTTI